MPAPRGKHGRVSRKYVHRREEGARRLAGSMLQSCIEDFYMVVGRSMMAASAARPALRKSIASLSNCYHVRHVTKGVVVLII